MRIHRRHTPRAASCPPALRMSSSISTRCSTVPRTILRVLEASHARPRLSASAATGLRIGQESPSRSSNTCGNAAAEVALISIRTPSLARCAACPASGRDHIDLRHPRRLQVRKPVAGPTLAPGTPASPVVINAPARAHRLHRLCAFTAQASRDSPLGAASAASPLFPAVAPLVPRPARSSRGQRPNNRHGAARRPSSDGCTRADVVKCAVSPRITAPRRPASHPPARPPSSANGISQAPERAPPGRPRRHPGTQESRRRSAAVDNPRSLNREATMAKRLRLRRASGNLSYLLIFRS